MAKKVFESGAKERWRYHMASAAMSAFASNEGLNATFATIAETTKVPVEVQIAEMAVEQADQLIKELENTSIPSEEASDGSV